MMPGEMSMLVVLGMCVLGMRGMDTRGMGIGWDWPWMLLWLPAVILPFIIARMLVAKPRTVRWAPIDIVARAVRRAGLSKSGFSLPLVLLRALLLLLAITAAARPLLGGRDAAGGRAGRSVEQVVAGTTALRRIILVEPSAGSMATTTPDAAPGPSALRLAIKALCTSGGFARSDDSLDGVIPAVDAVSSTTIATELAGVSGTPAAAAGTLVIATDGSLPIDFTAADGAAAGIAQAVDRGAALLVLLGPETVAGPAQQRLSDWLDRLTGIAIADRTAGAGQRIAVDPTLAEFTAGPAGAGRFFTLPGPSIGAFAELVLTPHDGQSVAVIARTVPDGRPLLVEARLGAGRICVSALPLSLGDPNGWSDLAAWPAFVPLVDRLVTRLITGNPESDPSPNSEKNAPPSATAPPLLASLLRLLSPARLLLAAAVLLALCDPLLSWLLSRQHVGPPAAAGPPLLQWLARTAILGILVALFIGAGPEGRRPKSDAGSRRKVAFLIDVSPSMATADAKSPADPRERVPRLLAVRQAIAAAAAGNPEASYFSVARDLIPIDPADLRNVDGIETIPVGPRASRLGDAVEETLTSGADRWSAIAIASDGLITAGATWDHAGRLARGRGIPLIAIPVGGDGATTTDAAVPRITITAARLPRIAWRGEEVTVNVNAEASARVDRVSVSLAARDGRLLAEGVLRRQPGNAAAEAAMPARLVGELRWKPTETGPQTLVVKASSDADLAGAIVATTRVVDEPVPVLLVDVAPRFEFRFLEHLLATDQRFRVASCLLEARGRGPAVAEQATPTPRLKEPLPGTAREWNQFDAVVLGDVRGADFDTDVTAGLLEAVRQDGLGVAWTPGRRWSSGASTNAGLGEFLPATAAADTADRTDSPVRLRWLPAAWQTGWYPAGEPSAAVFVVPEVGPEVGPEIWPLAGGVRLRPTARVLAVAEPAEAAARPAIVLDQHGAGVVLGHFFATWHLRGNANCPWKNPAVPFAGGGCYADYWRHTITRLAAGRMLARLVPATLDIRPLRPVAGVATRIDIVPTRPSAGRTGWQLEHMLPDGRREQLDASADTIRRDDLEPGWHTIMLTVPATGAAASPQRTAKVSQEFFVHPPEIEHPGPPAEFDAMQAAAIASGGGVVPLAALASLPDTIERLGASRPEPSPRWSDSLLMTNLLMLALLASCALEWSQRARRGIP